MSELEPEATYSEQDQDTVVADAAVNADLDAVAEDVAAVADEAGESDAAQAAPDEAAVVAVEPEVDPADEFKAMLRRQEGDWYVIHSYAGYENRVKVNLESRSLSLNMEEYIFEVQVPMEEVVEIKNAQRKVVNRVRIPGYVLHGPN